ncbi:MAG: hypothetical protein K6A36_03525 [Paludibacteraceae bacterium]|nr:hypothetical protein [Paludibacteraceae bacterium]
MKILVAPLNWGLGHASRCIPLIRQWVAEGNEVVLGGDGDSLLLLRKQFPALRYVQLASLNLRYSASSSQVWSMLVAIPKLIFWSVKDHLLLRAILSEENFDMVVSDNRFGLYITRPNASGQPECKCIYITHQLLIPLPETWEWAQPITARLHARIYARFDELWVPDYEPLEVSLAGKLSHSQCDNHQLLPIRYLGPLSRFNALPNQDSPLTSRYDVVAVLSGLEPQRSMLEKKLIERYLGKSESLLIVQGLIGRPNIRITRGNITQVPYMRDEELIPLLLQATRIIARSGYSTIMDLHALNLLSKAELIPTPGQPEQEYLAHWMSSKLSQ